MLYRKVFVFQTELWLSPFKWIMYQPSSMFVARELSKNCDVSLVSFFVTPFKSKLTIQQSWSLGLDQISKKKYFREKIVWTHL